MDLIEAEIMLHCGRFKDGALPSTAPCRWTNINELKTCPILNFFNQKKIINCRKGDSRVYANTVCELQ